MPRKTWTPEQELMLSKLYPNTDTLELVRIFNRSACAIKSRANRLGLHRDPEFVSVPVTSPWRHIDMDRFRELYPKLSDPQLAQYFGVSESAIANRAHKLGLKKNPERRLVGRFHKGQEPWNKGKKGIQIGGKATQFKKGSEPHNTRKDGDITIRHDKSGHKYKWIRISKAKWRMYHVYLWEQHFGPVPRGKIIVFDNKDTLDARIENLKLITRREHMMRNQNREKFRQLVEVEKTRLAYGMDPKSGLGRHWLKLRQSDKNVIAINTKPARVDLAI